MHRASGAALALHLDHRGHCAPHVGFTLRGPLVDIFAHGRGRGDRVDRHNFIRAVSYRSHRLVSIDNDRLLRHANRLDMDRLTGTSRPTSFTKISKVTGLME